MQTASVQRNDNASSTSPAPAGREFIVLGGPPPDISGLNLLNLEGAIGSDCDGILLLKHIDVSELAEVLSLAPDPTVPIADFFGNHSVRRDFVSSFLNDETVKGMQKMFAPHLAPARRDSLSGTNTRSNRNGDTSSCLFA